MQRTVCPALAHTTVRTYKTKTRHTPLHLLQPWQARFLCRDSDYVWDSVQAHTDLFLRAPPVKYPLLSSNYILQIYILFKFLRAIVQITLEYIQYRYNSWRCPSFIITFFLNLQPNWAYIS